MGFGAAMIIIPILPDMLEAVEEEYPLLDQEYLNNEISGLFIACQGLGEALGPVYGSTSESMYGFRTTEYMLAIMITFFMVCYFLLCGNFKLIGFSNKQPKFIVDGEQKPEQRRQQEEIKTVDDEHHPKRSEQIERTTIPESVSYR